MGFCLPVYHCAFIVTPLIDGTQLQGVSVLILSFSDDSRLCISLQYTLLTLLLKFCLVWKCKNTKLILDHENFLAWSKNADMKFFPIEGIIPNPCKILPMFVKMIFSWLNININQPHINGIVKSNRQCFLPILLLTYPVNQTILCLAERKKYWNNLHMQEFYRVMNLPWFSMYETGENRVSFETL